MIVTLTWNDIVVSVLQSVGWQSSGHFEWVDVDCGLDLIKFYIEKRPLRINVLSTKFATCM